MVNAKINKVIKNEKIYKLKNKEELIQILFNDKNITNKLSSIREIIYRCTDLKLYPNQILGAVSLYNGNIIEMKTGEGKTVVALAASLLLTSFGKKTHIITVNEYLAERDYLFSKQVYDYINKRCEVILANTENKKDIYDNADLIYITNSELGFDYLRSNEAYDVNQVVFNNDNAFAIIDEADSVLIDEAKIPLILSIPKNLKMEDYTMAQNFVKTLNNEDYNLELKEKRAFLTEKGAIKCEKYFNIENYSNISATTLRHLINQALVANYILKKDVDYIVKNNEIMLIDANTGRIAEGRRYNKGLHQAIEAKEKKEIKPETATVGSITYQKLFKLYTNFAGMTGTIMTEKEELKDIYGKKPVAIPSNRPVIRKDLKDLYFRNNKERNDYLVNLVKELNSIGRPILIGTASIIESEKIAQVLTRAGFTFNLLNAKNDKFEAEIVAQAGQKGAITIATNMAGRGTDIKLGEGVASLGGLALIGIGHYDFVRIDNQLRGRAGRQGDPGSSIFLVSLEDSLINTFASDRLKALAESLIKDDKELGVYIKGLEKGLKKAQNAISTTYYNARKSTTDYDNILNIYRNMFYKDRMKVLFETDIKSMIMKFSPNIKDDKLNKLLKEENIKVNILGIMDTYWINFLDIAEDLKTESIYNSYSGIKSNILYEDKLADIYDEMLKTISNNIKDYLNK